MILKDIKEFSDKEIYKDLLSIRTKDQIQFLLSYKMDIRELYLYIFGKVNICECSIEMQCAVYDTVPLIYDNYVDSYYIFKTRDMRLDKDLKFLIFPYGFNAITFFNLEKGTK